MNFNPMISVVMSVYNAEKYLDEAIQSILHQSYKDFEFIIINDGSTDRSLEIIKKYQNKDKRIILITRENKGLIFSLNEGIKKSKGKYIARMDADDISLPERFQSQIKLLESNNEIGVCGTAIIGFSDDMKKNISYYSENNKELKTELLFSSVFAHPTVMMRRKLFKKFNLKYEEKYKNAEDFGLWVQMSEYTKFSNIKDPLLKYRILDDSITRLADKYIEDRYKIIKSIFQNYLDKLELENTEQENRLHFNLTVNARIKDSNISFNILKKYFKKIEYANNKKKLFSSSDLKKVLGKKWLWNLYYTKNIRGIFSMYLFYGVWSILSK